MTLPRYLVLGVVTLTSAFGDTSLAVGMKRVGPVSLSHPAALVAALQTPWVFGGVLLLLLFFASYLTALSWADLTFVLPATSLAYVAVAFLSKFWLHEQISAGRWLGIALITAGVGFVTQGPSFTPRHVDEPSPGRRPGQAASSAFTGSLQEGK
jgi:drug/metabolite transporter (DMT)-like permease